MCTVEFFVHKNNNSKKKKKQSGINSYASDQNLRLSTQMCAIQNEPACKSTPFLIHSVEL